MFERIVEFLPAYDKRHDDPDKNYGIHGVDLRMVLKGDQGAVQFVLFTGWHLPHVAKELKRKSRSLSDPLPADRGYHSLHPIYDEQEPFAEECPYLDGEPCYYDGSGLAAEDVYVILLEKGSDGVWEHLEEYYQSVFREED